MSSRTLISCIRGPATVSRWLWPYLINYHSPKHAVKLYLRSLLQNLCQSGAHQNSIFWNPLHFLSKKKSNKRLLGTHFTIFCRFNLCHIHHSSLSCLHFSRKKDFHSHDFSVPTKNQTLFLKQGFLLLSLPFSLRSLFLKQNPH